MRKEIKLGSLFLALILMGVILGYSIGRVTVEPKIIEKEVVKDVEKEVIKYVEVIAIEQEPKNEKQETVPEFVSMGVFETTAYCSCADCCGKTDGITASGTQATAGRTIAADTSIFPFGTELYINGNKYVVEDTGGAIKGNRIDIYFSTHAEALQYGRRNVEVYMKG